MSKIKVTVLFEVNPLNMVLSAQCVLENIDRNRFEVQTIGITKMVNGSGMKVTLGLNRVRKGEEEARSQLRK